MKDKDFGDVGKTPDKNPNESKQGNYKTNSMKNIGKSNSSQKGKISERLSKRMKTTTMPVGPGSGPKGTKREVYLS